VEPLADAGSPVGMSVAEAPAAWRAWPARLRSVLRQRYAIVLLAAILLLGAGLRLYRLGDVPAGFFCDEASVGYNAYTILTTGADEYGVSFPVFFRAFGEYKSPIEIYSTVPSVAVFGLNEFATRLPSALYGVLSILAIYLLVRQLCIRWPTREALALLSALFLAISPWDIQFSRVALEGLMPFVCFTLLGLYLFLKAQERPGVLPVAIAVFALALYSYFPARIFIPLFAIALCCLYYRFFLRHKYETLLSGIVLATLLVPFIANLLGGEGLARWQQVSVFANPPPGEPIWQHIVVNYLSHFSLDFLFTAGDIGMPGQMVLRHSVRGMGELYLFQLPLVVLGLVSVARSRSKEGLILLLWVLFYPVGSMFTTDTSVQATRSIIGVVPWQILSAIGLVFLFQLCARAASHWNLPSMDLTTLQRLRGAYALAGGIAAALLLVSFVSYVSSYFVSYNTYASGFWGWQYGPRQVVAYFVQHQDSYDDMVLAPEFNAPEIFFTFYAPNDCHKCAVGLPEDSYRTDRRQLFAVTPGYAAMYAGRDRTVATVKYPDGSTAFVLIEITAAP
jgi:4-amino-4-deoxy-L-arabinose transferase-like glycosyltransferase